MNRGTGVYHSPPPSPPREPPLSRYEAQKLRDWNTFVQYLKDIDRYEPGTGKVSLAECKWTHVLFFFDYLDSYGKTLVHNPECPMYGLPDPPEPCRCPHKQAWGSLDSMVGRLRAAFEELSGVPDRDLNPFSAVEVRNFLRLLREEQAMARGIRYNRQHKKVRLKVRVISVPVADLNADPLPDPDFINNAAAEFPDVDLNNPAEFPDVDAGEFPEVDFNNAGEFPEVDYNAGVLPGVVHNSGGVPNVGFNAGEFPDIDFTASLFSDADFNAGVLPGVDFNGGVFPGVDFNAGVFPGVGFNGGVLEGVDFSAGVLPGVDFNGGVLPGVDFNAGEGTSEDSGLPPLPEVYYDCGE